MTLIETRIVNLVPVDGYYENNEAWFTRNQIGSALEYSDPNNAIILIHRKHKDRLDKFSLGCQLDTPAGKRQGYVYNIRGVFEICRWSRQPKADMVMDALYDMAESIIEKGYYTTMSAEDTIKALAAGMDYDHFMEDVVFPAIEMQDEFTFDELLEHYCGFPVRTKEDLRQAKEVFQETSKARKQRLSRLCYCANDYCGDEELYRKFRRVKWAAPENRGHSQVIQGVRWFDDYILNQIK